MFQHCYSKDSDAVQTKWTTTGLTFEYWLLEYHMKRRATHHRTKKSWRRFVSLFLSVVWLSALLQPCVMAGSNDRADRGLTGTGQIATAAHHHGDCAQCSSLSTACDNCSSASNHSCSKGESTVAFDSTAAFDHKTKVKKIDLFAFTVVPLANRQLQLDTALFETPPERFSSGPSLIDLYCTYLI